VKRPFHPGEETLSSASFVFAFKISGLNEQQVYASHFSGRFAGRFHREKGVER